MSTVFVAPNAQFTALDPDLDIFGGSGIELVRVRTSATNADINPNVERVDFDAPLSAFSFQVTGNVVIVRMGATIVASVVVQDDADGTRFRFYDGGADLRITGLNMVTLGGQPVSTAAGGAPISSAAMGANFNPADPSSLTPPPADGKAPTVTDGQSFSINENSAAGSAVGTVQATDPDTKAPDNVLTFSIAGGDPSGAFNIDAATGAITVKDASKLNFETTPSFALNVKATDGTGLSDTATVTVNVGDVNESPSVKDGQNFVVAVSAANGSAVGSVVASDPDSTAPNKTLTYAITAGNTNSALAIDAATGAITVADKTKLDTTTPFNLTVKTTDGGGLSDDALVTVTVTETNTAPVVNDGQSFSLAENSANTTAVGTVVATDADASTPNKTLSYAITAGNGSNAFAINAATGAITVNDTSKLDFETTPAFTLAVKSTDSGNPALFDESLVGITLTDKNEAPKVNDGQSFTLAENSANGGVVGSVIASDPDSTAPNKTLGFTITAGNGSGAFVIDNTGQIKIADSSKLDFDTTPVFTLTVKATDGGNPALSDDATVTITLTDKNEAPTVADNQVFTANEGTANNTLIGIVQASDPDSTAPNKTLSFSITGGNTNNAFVIDAATGKVFVADKNQLDFQTNPVFNLTVKATDGGNPTLFDDAVVQVKLGDVNQAPTVTAGQSFTLNEHSANGTNVGTVLATDPDNPGTPNATLAFTIVGGDPNKALAIDKSSGQLTVADSTKLDFETAAGGQLTVTVRATDGAGVFDDENVVVKLNDVNEAPVLPDGKIFTLEENKALGFSVGTVAGVDPDKTAPNNTLLHSLTVNPGGAFSIVAATGEIKVADSSKLDFETTGTLLISVKATDGKGLFDETTVTINLTDANEAPVIDDTTRTILENSALNANVGAVLTATDPDKTSPANTFTFAITAGNEAGAFALNANSGQITVADPSKLDFETTKQFKLTVAATDGGNPVKSDTALVTINVGDKNEAPDFPGDFARTVEEMKANGTPVGAPVVAIDPDTTPPNNTLTYSIVAGNGAGSGAFAIDGSGQISVADSAQLIAASSFNLTVKATDGNLKAPLSDTTNVVITVSDKNEAPTYNDALRTVDENSANGTLVGVPVTATDPDPTSPNKDLTYTITAGNTGGAFAINSMTGQVTVANTAQLNFETTPVFNLTVKATDGGGLSDTAALNINLGNVNEAPTVDDGQARTIAENSANGTNVGTKLTATDPDAGDTLTWTITGGNASGAFSITAGGQLKVADSSKLDFETTPNFTLTVKATDSGALFDTADVFITLTDVADPISVIKLATLDGNTGFQISGESPGDLSGSSASNAGDVNGDGFDDLIVGAYGLSDIAAGAGGAYVVFGKAGGMPAEIKLSTVDGTNGFQVNGEAANDSAGHDVSGSGDFNGDGFTDLIIGAAGAGPAGASYVVFGKASGLPATLNLSTLDGNNGFQINGELLGDASGTDVANAGDVNGDGLDDLIVGSVSADPNGQISAGTSHVIFGKAGGFAPEFNLSTLDGSNGFKFSGDTMNDFSGDSVAAAGDVNGDGFGDLIIGAPGADPGGTVTGAAYVVFGKAGGFTAEVKLALLNGNDGFRLNGEALNNTAGRAVSSVGDVNGDGFDDVIVGAGSKNRSYVVFGAAGGFAASIDLSSLNGSNGFAFDGASTGYSVAGAGDVNGDGFDDVFIGAPYTSPEGLGNEGSSYVVFGKAGPFAPLLTVADLDGTKGFKVHGEAMESRSAWAGGGVGGDIDGDGFDDLVIGGYVGDPNGLAQAGLTHVVFGFRTDGGAITLAGTSGDDTKTLGPTDKGIDGGAGNDTLTGNANANTLIGGQGDDTLDGAGGNDVLIGGQGKDTLIHDPLDTLRVDGGHDLDTLRFTTGGNTLNLTARNAANQDFQQYTGIDVIDLSSAAGTDNSLLLNALDLYHLTDHNLLRVDGGAGDSVNTTLSPNSASDWIRRGASDEDGDPGLGYTRYDNGEAVLLVQDGIDQLGIALRLELSELDGKNGSQLNGELAFDLVGRGVAIAGDVNGDGFDDIFVSAYAAGPNGEPFAGASYVIFGKPGGLPANLELSSLDGNNGFQISGEKAVDVSGTHLSGAGDFNGDGFADLIIGADLADPNGLSAAGAAYVVFGKAGGFAPELKLSTLTGSAGGGFQISGEAVNDNVGFEVGSAGDVNGDGFDDLIAGARGVGGTDAGASYVVFGKDSGFGAELKLSTLTAAQGFQINGAAAGDSSGSSVAAGDVNGDGFDDLIIGSPNADPNGSYSGAVHVVFGKSASFGTDLNLMSLPAASGFQISGEKAFDESGIAVSAGDVNGDGFADLIIGATGVADKGANSGATYVVFGSAASFGTNFNLSTLNGLNGFQINGEQVNDIVGFSVANAGDVNADGYDDLIVAGAGADPNGFDSGASYVIYGRAGGFAPVLDLSALNAGTGFQINGEAAGDGSGFRVNGGGDVNGDGYADLIVGATNHDPNGLLSAGAAYVVYGFASTGSAINVVGSSADDSITLIAGQTGVDGGAGKDQLTGDAGANTLIGGQGDDTLDGAGGNDLLIGGQGKDTLLFDAADTLGVDGGHDSDTLRFATGGNTLNLTTLNAANQDFQRYTGIDVVDLNSTAGTNNTLSLNALDLFHLTDHNLLRVDGGAGDAVATTAGNWTNKGPTNADGNPGAGYTRYENGEAVLLVQNGVDQSGINAVAAGELNLSSLNGANGFQINGEVAGDDSGRSVASAGDVNGDGFDDLIIGAPFVDDNGTLSGASYVVFGKSGGFPAELKLVDLNGSNGFQINGELLGDYSGITIGGAGDVNGDGFDDLIVGAPNADPNGASSGQTYVVFGKASGFTTNFELSLLDGSNGFQINGEKAGDISGRTVDSAGDVNGDGFDDVIISARLADPNALGDEGASYVVFGKAGGFAAELNLSTLDGSNGFQLSGEAAGDNSGTFVASAGDINGDGFDELIVGAYFGDRNALKDAGATHVVYGKASGFAAEIKLGLLTGPDGFEISGEAAYDQSGFSVASAGDINGDGFDDLIVGANKADPNGSESGASYLVFGKATSFGAELKLSTLTGSGGAFPGVQINGEAAGDRAGRVQSAGDFNGDGFDDLIIGAFPASAYTGASYVVFGKATAFAATLNLSTLDGKTGVQISGEAAGDFSGRSVFSAGDVNGDGYDDVIIGADGADPSGAGSGASYVVFGFATDGGAIDVVGSSADDTITLTALQTGVDGGAGKDTLTGNANNNTLIGGQGDDTLDGAGGKDVLIGGSGKDVLIFDTLDTLRVDGGHDLDTLRFTSGGNILNLTGRNAANQDFQEYTGIDVIDLNAAAGTDNVLSLNALDLFHLTDHNFLRVDGGKGDAVNTTAGDWTKTGPVNLDGNAGTGYTRYENGDAVLVVKDGVSQTGIALRIELSALNGANGFRLNGEAASDGLGRGVAIVGDINGDGFDDAFVAAERADANALGNSGASYLVFGKASGIPANFDLSSLNGTNGFQISGELAGDYSGTALSGAGDFNGDGFGDLLIGADGADPTAVAGASYIVFGKAAAFPAELQLSSLTGSAGGGFQINGDNTGDTVGFSVHNAGDVNGDGFDDVILGARFADPNAKNYAGASFVVFGKATGFATEFNLNTLNGANGFQINGEAVDDRTGSTVSSAGDFNGDGFDDLIVGSYLADPNAVSNAGAGYIVFGKASGFPAEINLLALPATFGFRLSGELTKDYSGAVASAGDVNGDGFGDVIIGANGVDDNGSRSGAAYVVFGSAASFGTELKLSTLNGTNGFQISGELTNDFAGTIVERAGDVNADGYDDLIVSATGVDLNGGGSGSVYVVYGRAPGSFTANLNLVSLDGSTGFQINGEEAGDSAGFRANGTGDVNGDGYDDLIVGATNATPNGLVSTGAGYVLYGFANTGSAITVNGTGGNDTITLTAAQTGVDGGVGDDVLNGNASANTLIGGVGNDTLDGKAGNDVLIGGAGDDVLIFDALDTLRVDGGAGSDTLKLTGGVDIDFTILQNLLITGINRLDLEDVGANALKMRLDDVLALSEPNRVGSLLGTNDLVIFGDAAGDTVDLGPAFAGAGTFAGLGDGRSYNIFTAAGSDAFLLIENTIAVSLV